jgi:FkbM family methyltransferase
MFYYAHRALYKLGFYDLLNITATAVINNNKFKIPVINGTGYYHLLEHEDWFQKLLQQLLPNASGSFVDVGMNIGQTMLKVKSIVPQQNYIGFEPNPLCAYYCNKLIEANEFKDCTVYPFGLFDRTDVLTLYMDKDHASGASVLQKLRKNMDRYRKKIKVPVFTGDEIFAKEYKQIGLLKADVEGAELEVIKGLLNTIKRDMPVIILEILPVYDVVSENGKYRKEREDELLKILYDLGYIMFLINEKDATLSKLEEITVHGDMSKTNYLFIHSSRANAI